MSEPNQQNTTPRFCSGPIKSPWAHVFIQWFDPRVVECPLCAAIAKVEKLEADNAAATSDERYPSAEL